MRIRWQLVLGMLVGLNLVTTAVAQNFPSRPIKFVVPFPPGGLVDTLARVVGDDLANELGQPVVIDNRAGAASKLGAQFAAKSDPDGYTLFLANGTTNGTLPVVDPAFDPVKDFLPVSTLTLTPFILAVSPELGVNSLPELIARAKAKPGELNYATPGTGTAAHFAGEMLKSMAGIDIVHVPYRGLAPALTDLLSGRVHMTFDSTILELLKTGKLKAIGTTGLQRSPFAMDVPTLDEAGLKGYDVVGWAGIAVPAGTPREIVARLNAATKTTMAKPAVQNRLRDLGLVPASSSPAEMAKLIDDSIARYRMIATKNNLKFD